MRKNLLDEPLGYCADCKTALRGIYQLIRIRKGYKKVCIACGLKYNRAKSKEG